MKVFKAGLRQKKLYGRVVAHFYRFVENMLFVDDQPSILGCQMCQFRNLRSLVTSFTNLNEFWATRRGLHRFRCQLSRRRLFFATEALCEGQTRSKC